MRLALVHQVPGRIRFRLDPSVLKRYRYAALARAITDIPPVKSAAINPRTGSILIYHDTGASGAKEIFAGLEALHLEEFPRRAEEPSRPSLGWSYIGYHIYRLLQPESLKPLLTFLGALPYFAAGLKALAAGKMNIDLLDASAIGMAMIQKNFASASSLIMLLKTGGYLEKWAKLRSRESLEAAISLKVDRVWIRAQDGDRELPYSQLKTGDIVIVRAGSMIPVDGRVEGGNALVNESSMTGELLSASRSAGDTVHAGTVIEEGELFVCVKRKGADTRFEKILHLVREAEAAKARVETRASEIADKVVPFNFLAAGLTFLASGSLRKASAALSVDYSCAIKLSTPLVFLAAMKEGLYNGVFFKGGAPLEAFAKTDTIVFDKTGTLTRATPQVDGIIAYNGYDEYTVLKIAACLEEHFPHPVAKAIVKHAVERKTEHKEEHAEVKYIVAHGIATEYRGKHTLIGSRHFISEDEGVDISPAAADEEAAARRGCSALYLARDGLLAGMICIHDPVREEAPEVIAMLRRLGIRNFVMLTGDNVRAAERVARELGIECFRGDVLPQDKAAYINLLKGKGYSVAVVGDGMNDSPALAAAGVGIAMKDGADLARNVADITLRDPSLYPLVIARLMSQGAMKRIHANTVSAIGINSLLMFLSIFGGISVTASVWLHNLTTLGISLNSMRKLLPK
ncbi:MAG: heavy metal translocating P-type ATPase [Spirochaetales bacterium]|jgi:Cu2+-exporting ATPase|nr:heavy metal translocating P-type ATPase [Spirochaetales bacterium]